MPRTKLEKLQGKLRTYEHRAMAADAAMLRGNLEPSPQLQKKADAAWDAYVAVCREIIKYKAKSKN